MTVEASLVLPLFLLLFMNLLSIIEVYRIHSNVAASLWERGREETVVAYLRAQIKGGESRAEGLQTLLGSFTGRISIAKNLGTFSVWEKIVGGGEAGFLVSEKMEDNGTVRIDCSYRIHPLFASLTPVTKNLENHYYGHSWVGYIHGGEEGAQEQDDTYVYISETGTVYHRNRGCSYLNPSIQQVQARELENLRNKGGAVYYSCPLCDGHGEEGTYYVTDYGTGYHTNITCSGLKRTIYQVKLSEVGGKGACSKCGG